MIVGEERRDEIAKFLTDRCPFVTLGATPYSVLGNADAHGKLIAAVVYEDFTKRSIEAHIAADGKGWLTPDYLGAIFRYPFRQLKVHRIICKIPASNAPSIKLCESFGFTREGLIREALPGDEDLLIYGMLDRECPHLEVGLHGQEQRAAAG